MYKKRLTFVILLCACLMCFIFYSENIEKGDSKRVSADVFYQKEVALTFDDGPGGETTKQLLDGLKERGVRASFFVVGENIEGNEQLIARMHNEGHIIGNHTYSHAVLNKISHDAALLEITKTNEAIEAITGEPVEFIRPPCGAWNDKLMYDVNMTPVFWDVDPKDWCTYNSSVVVDRVMSQVKDGDIILFHDIYDTSITAALEVVDRLKAQGYVFVTIDEIIIE